jgi:hypothetical protein
VVPQAGKRELARKADAKAHWTERAEIDKQYAKKKAYHFQYGLPVLIGFEIWLAGAMHTDTFPAVR